jgi:predicted NBD/HSP70 family sugar kinase
MPRCIGVVVSEHIAFGVVDGDAVVGTIGTYPVEGSGSDLLHAMPADEMVRRIADEVKAMAEGEPLEAIGLAFPGIVRGGVITESPNFNQLKGVPMEQLIRAAMVERNVECGKVGVSNDADVVAAGIAAKHGKLDQLVRVWMLGNGIGFGRYPVADGVWEGGHIVVTLDPNEKFCGCGGRGHLEGIMGNRAMRLRFLDLEPEEVFEQAKSGEDPRCVEFALLWHRALAAATASSIHMSGPGKFYISGMNERFVNVTVLNRCVQEMVKMSSLQGYVFEVVPKSDDVALVGAVVNARRGEIICQ